VSLDSADAFIDGIWDLRGKPECFKESHRITLEAVGAS
jgi:hypothetical protein